MIQVWMHVHFRALRGVRRVALDLRKTVPGAGVVYMGTQPVLARYQQAS